MIYKFCFGKIYEKMWLIYNVPLSLLYNIFLFFNIFCSSTMYIPNYMYMILADEMLGTNKLNNSSKSETESLLKLLSHTLWLVYILK